MQVQSFYCVNSQRKGWSMYFHQMMIVGASTVRSGRGLCWKYVTLTNMLFYIYGWSKR